MPETSPQPQPTIYDSVRKIPYGDRELPAELTQPLVTEVLTDDSPYPLVLQNLHEADPNYFSSKEYRSTQVPGWDVQVVTATYKSVTAESAAWGHADTLVPMNPDEQSWLVNMRVKQVQEYRFYDQTGHLLTSLDRILQGMTSLPVEVYFIQGPVAKANPSVVKFGNKQTGELAMYRVYVCEPVNKEQILTMWHEVAHLVVEEAANEAYERELQAAFTLEQYQAAVVSLNEVIARYNQRQATDQELDQAYEVFSQTPPLKKLRELQMMKEVDTWYGMIELLKAKGLSQLIPNAEELLHLIFSSLKTRLE